MSRSIAVIGLGKLGASMAAAFASRGHNVIGVDINRENVDAINNGHQPVQETGLDQLIQENKSRLRATLSTEEAILASEICFVIVPTPSDDRGAFSLQYSAYAFKEIGLALAKKEGYYTVVMTSTVLPGSMRYGLLPILEKYSGKKCGVDFGLCYSPEFIALGSILNDLLNPDFVLLGEYDEKCGDQLEACYRDVMVNNPPIKRMLIENAELSKISLNAFVTMKITFANMLADMCNKIPGGDVDKVTDAIGTDTRIGRKYLTGAIGYGGPCFPRDNVALSFIMDYCGAVPEICKTTDGMNRKLGERMVLEYADKIEAGTTVALLGLSYKPFSHVTEESQAIKLAEALLSKGVRVIGYDPMAREMADRDLHGRALLFDNVKDCLAQAEVVMVVNADPEFMELEADDFTNNFESVTVIDFWRILADKLTGVSGIDYIPYGRCVDSDSAGEKLDQLWAQTAAHYGC